MRIEISEYDYLNNLHEITFDNPVTRAIESELMCKWDGLYDVICHTYSDGYKIHKKSSSDEFEEYFIQMEKNGHYEGDYLDVSCWIMDYCEKLKCTGMFDSEWLEDFDSIPDYNLDSIYNIVVERLNNGYGHLKDRAFDILKQDNDFLKYYEVSKELLPFSFNVDLRRMANV